MGKVKAAGLFLVNKDGKILVGHPTHHVPEFWSIPKGKLDKGETPLQAAIRETYEESNVKLFIDLHTFIELGTIVYRHKKKEITFFAIVEPEHAKWHKLNIRCNSNVPEERGGFPEMDAFKWVTIEEARGILHETQVAVLYILKEKIKDYRDELAGKYPLILCNSCKNQTFHREKLSAVLSGHRVCNECSMMNPVCILTKEGSPQFEKVSNEVMWLEFNDDGTFKEKFNEPKVGRSLIMSPFNDFFTWRTTKIVEIIEEQIVRNMNYIKFRTENSTYELITHKL